MSMLKINFRDRNNRILNIAPTRIIVFSFILLILAGAALLNLPIASKDGKSIGFIDALFTSTSASCVTGLIVVDTYRHWTLFGQIVIISLIQIGGLGIVTLATFFSVIIGRKVGLKGMLLAQESINHFSFQGIVKLIKRVILVTFAIELTGALLLSISFVPRFGVKGFYLGIFHAISAFCNAGFDLMGIWGDKFQSLTSFNNDPIVIYTVGSLIIIGGLGFMVWKDLFDYIKYKSLLLHTKIVLIMTACLIVSGFIFFFIAEHNNTMKDLSLFEQINASYFQSVSPRTAGFNSIDQGQMLEISKFGTIILMFIGAAPGSTGGGIKVTTFSVIIMAVVSQIIGSNETIVMKRRVPSFIVNKALSILGLSAILVVTVTTIILAAESNNTHVIGNGGAFLNVLYEATSAFGTVGLTTGITPYLGKISKAVLILTMFLGRVGPLTFAISLTLRANRKSADVIYPEGKIMVG